MPTQPTLDLFGMSDEPTYEVPDEPTYEVPGAQRHPETQPEPPEHEFYLCPFCGARTGRVVRQRVGYAFMCRKCCAMGPVADTSAEAVPLWNTRVIYSIEERRYGRRRGAEETWEEVAGKYFYDLENEGRAPWVEDDPVFKNPPIFR